MNRNDRTRHPVRSGSVRYALACLAIVSGSAFAQSANALYAEGNSAYDANRCVRAASRYYALQVRYPEWLNQQVIDTLNARIGWCENHSSVYSSVKGDKPGETSETVPPKPNDVLPNNLASHQGDRCVLYATIAVTQYRINRLDNCGFADSRWNDDFNRHQAWCMGVGNKALDVENQARQQGLAACHH